MSQELLEMVLNRISTADLICLALSSKAMLLAIGLPDICYIRSTRALPSEAVWCVALDDTTRSSVSERLFRDMSIRSRVCNTCHKSLPTNIAFWYASSMLSPPSKIRTETKGSRMKLGSSMKLDVLASIAYGRSCSLISDIGLISVQSARSRRQDTSN